MHSQVKGSHQFLISVIDTVNPLRDHVISVLVHSYFRIIIMIQSIGRITTDTQCLILLIHITEKITTVTH